MVSARRKYPGVADHTTEPVTTAPVSEVAKAPDAVETPQPVEELEPKPSPAEAAASSAIKQRLEESQRAAELVKQQAQQPPPQQFAAEPETPQMDERDQFEAAIQHLPPRIQTWYRNDPSWLTDPERAACITYAHHVSLRETGSVGSDDYYRRMESLMGLRDASPEPSPERSRASEPAPRQYSGAPVSAPPSRESHSMATGRPVDRVSLSHEEAALAKSLGLTSQQYLDGKARMLREKQGGFHRDE
jgi:hypothetical protein